MINLTINLPCANKDCRKHIDGKCSIWDKPTLDMCPDFETAWERIFSNAAIPMHHLAVATQSAMRQAQEQERNLANMSQRYPLGGIILKASANDKGFSYRGSHESVWPIPSALEEEKTMLESNLEYTRKEIIANEGKIRRSQTLCNTMIDRLLVINRDLKRGELK